MKKDPAALQFEDMNTDFVLKFLNDLEQGRGNSARTRNLRLAAIRSFMRYVSYLLPGSLSTIQEVLAIPLKRFDQPSLEFLQREEMEAIIAAPDKSTPQRPSGFCHVYDSLQHRIPCFRDHQASGK